MIILLGPESRRAHSAAAGTTAQAVAAGQGLADGVTFPAANGAPGQWVTIDLEPHGQLGTGTEGRCPWRRSRTSEGVRGSKIRGPARCIPLLTVLSPLPPVVSRFFPIVARVRVSTGPQSAGWPVASRCLPLSPLKYYDYHYYYYVFLTGKKHSTRSGTTNYMKHYIG